ncbi:zinc ribbon domain-containing protein [Nocardiopsis sp. CNR-923]|uniref:zinc ribbon domain-containing protein n=1 Tax=Nocardiopsis sp. CNR-923 TaxID=1904965 RepID=UPI0029165A85|nr:zinc ribbon domain-containing protein [Nocardiopsis sp. CNR-923]
MPVVFVDPASTSQMCCGCDHVDKRDRVDQGLLICRACGVVAHADRNASHNIATRGATVWNAGRESRAPCHPVSVWPEEPTQQPVGRYLQARPFRARSS